MLKPEQIPDQVSNKVMAFFHTRYAAKCAIADALNAWPCAHTDELCNWRVIGAAKIIHLPVVEDSNDPR